MNHILVHRRERKHFSASLQEHKVLYLMLVPGFLLTILFNYVPMVGVVMAFKEYTLGLGIWESPWVGFKQFRLFFSNPDCVRVLGNTIIISMNRILWGFPVPILLAITLSEIGNRHFRSIALVIGQLPHFLSWVVLSGVVINILSPSTGVVNYVIEMLGGTPKFFLSDPSSFRAILVLTGIWKEAGWGTLVYMASVSCVEVDRLEAAAIDGANRLQRVRYVVLPSILPAVFTMLLLEMGDILNAGFDQVFNLYNTMVLDVADIIDTYVYRTGLGQMQYSYASAVGLFKSCVGLVMMILVYFLTKSMDRRVSGSYFHR